MNRALAVLAAVAIGVATGPATGPATASPPAAGTLTVTGMPADSGLGAVAVSGTTAAVGGQAIGADPSSGAVYVFTRPRGGWTSESQAAELVASDPASEDSLGFFDSSVGISASTVVASAREASTGPTITGEVFVFRRPAAGWSGTVTESAILAPSPRSRCVNLGPVAVSGSTIVASCEIGSAYRAPGAALVFTEPSGGWAGAESEAAELLPARGSIMWEQTPIVISGATILAGGYSQDGRRGFVYVYREPRHGWRGSIRPSATLSASKRAFFDQLAMAGPTVFATTNGGPVYVFAEPRHGWSGTVHESAELVYPSPEGTVPSVAAAGRRVAVSFDSLGSEHQCPCGGTVDAFVEPARGWRGRIRPRASIAVTSETGATPLAIAGRTLFASGDSEVRLLQLP